MMKRKSNFSFGLLLHFISIYSHMSSQSSNPQIHASVLQFLMNHGYMESVEAFKREARRHLDLLPASQVSDEQLAHDLSHLQIQRY
jgi:hypothetical protein